mmetsp:Transcript_31620/g.63111  ORF Transcript_31620/g.63111 Transcript_31620/m.63111 type:complete len:230 (+) Transcript_31620:547-1236(+)
MVLWSAYSFTTSSVLERPTSSALRSSFIDARESEWSLKLSRLRNGSFSSSTLPCCSCFCCSGLGLLREDGCGRLLWPPPPPALPFPAGLANRGGVTLEPSLGDGGTTAPLPFSLLSLPTTLPVLFVRRCDDCDKGRGRGREELFILSPGLLVAPSWTPLLLSLLLLLSRPPPPGWWLATTVEVDDSPDPRWPLWRASTVDVVDSRDPLAGSLPELNEPLPPLAHCALDA